MTDALTSQKQATYAASLVMRAFDAYHSEFKRISSRAQARFEQRDWQRSRQDAAERLDLYARVVKAVIAELNEVLAGLTTDQAVWIAMKQVYAQQLEGRPDVELAETFFNSVTRKIFVTVGVNPDIEFVGPMLDVLAFPNPELVYTTYGSDGGSLTDLTRAILLDQPFGVAYQDIERDARLVAEMIAAEVRAVADGSPIEQIDMLKPVFYRGAGAYVIGRIHLGRRVLPLVLPLQHTAPGIAVDAALLTEDEASIIFSFAHSYFHAVVDHPYAVIAFLRSIMPRKQIAELYTALGYNKHGKTELYRDLLGYLDRTDDAFAHTPGVRGMVMIVFAMPGYDVVFKVIKDAFDYPKTATREQVKQKYELVFKHDRVGRLVDAQEFEYLRFHRGRFDAALLDELLTAAAQSVTLVGDDIIIKHLYTERKLVPLDMYLRRAEGEAAHDVVVDLGQAIKDLGAAGIFPGDTLLKNFGVTRHGRVVFYDYDDLRLLEQCHFRAVPVADDDRDLDGEPWFFAAEDDIFPEEIQTFIGLPQPYKRVFTETHSEIFAVRFWTELQEKHRRGELIEVFPYKAARRLPHHGNPAS
ncbi:MAG TPA: bifunctional isocitrate dehydrogenase kinase/phosphatase [Herpetosiphonaceae bacterium]